MTTRTEHPDERAFLVEDPELGIIRTDPENRHWPRWQNRYRKCVGLVNRRGGRWLDCACGSGYGTEIIAATADSVTGVDVDTITVKYAQKHHSRENIRFVNLDINDLAALSGDRFDVVVSIETIEHVLDPTPFLASICTLLSPGGVFVVTTPESQCGGGANPLNKFHLNEFTREQLTDLLGRFFMDVSLETEVAVFSTGVETVQLYATCRNVRRS